MDTMLASRASPDPEKLQGFVGRMLDDLGGAMVVPLVRIGDELGLYAALDGASPITPAELARSTGANERLLREWLSAHAAAGYLDYAPNTGRFTMTPEQAMVFARPDSPAFMLGAFEIAAANVLDHSQVMRAFRQQDGRGAGYGTRCACLFSGIARFFRPGYAAHLLNEWLPALDGMEERLRRGARVADLGCGHGASVILMAEAFPASYFTGLDYHAASIACAREAAGRAGVAGNTSFQVAGAADFAPGGYDLVACFDALHDMGDPVGVARRIRDALRSDGTFMAVEPKAGNRLEENINPVGRLYYAASTMICTPVSLDQPGAAALGAQAGPARLEALLREAGFSRVRIATETPFNTVLEAQP
ncbi:class I SAM-dependent methyltransferase [Roseomonas xinghualingensis]|uniref:class I SAM-dependent methyltransferase n=1 Tax=Roseomonas xinghualingensis TaxID=2986475 RepID=UPI0021F16B2E|nr:class I SAM-dependent methyltransferase [Roseomonas sp. SXEYE001]MCV4208252.1 methyltransferase domain-containing protein [Roseomonas sp. SXEYE001]